MRWLTSSSLNGAKRFSIFSIEFKILFLSKVAQSCRAEVLHACDRQHRPFQLSYFGKDASRFLPFSRTSFPALFAAILDLFPDLLPLLSPFKGLLADDANLFGEMGLFVSHRVGRRLK